MGFLFFKCDCCDCDLTGGLIMYMHLDYKLVCKMWARVGIELYLYILLVSCMSVVVIVAIYESTYVICTLWGIYIFALTNNFQYFTGQDQHKLLY